MRDARNAQHLAALIAGMDDWMPLVREMREAGKGWQPVARAVSEKLGVVWTTERARRSVKLLVAAGVAEKSLLAHAPPTSRAHDRLKSIIQAIPPGKTLSQIARHMEAIGEMTPRGHIKWHASTVALFLKSKRAKGRLPAPPSTSHQHSLRLES